MGVEEQMGGRESLIERLESLRRISQFVILIAVALTTLGVVFGDYLSFNRVTVGIIGATFVLAFALQRSIAVSLLNSIRREQDSSRLVPAASVGNGGSPSHDIHQ